MRSNRLTVEDVKLRKVEKSQQKICFSAKKFFFLHSLSKHLLQVCCTVFILLVAECNGLPSTIVSNFGGNIGDGWNAVRRFDYDTAFNETSVNLTAGIKGKLLALEGFGLGLRVGDNIEDKGVHSSPPKSTSTDHWFFLNNYGTFDWKN
ncbi:uncharacterized protein ACR2FA_005604 [Aphomia sociella]